MNLIFTLFLAVAAAGTAFCQPQASKFPEKPVVAIPLFNNATGGHVTRIAPGKYRERNVRVGSEHRTERFEESGKSVLTSSERDVYEKQLERDVEYAPGEYALPEAAALVATDAATEALNSTGRFLLLARSTPVLKMLENETAFAGTGTAGGGADQAFQILRDMGASYVLYGSINNFRIDENKGMTYGVRRWQVITSVSLDLKLVDVNSKGIISSRNMLKKSVMNIPEGMSQIDSMYDWEQALRAAISNAIPEFLQGVFATLSGNTGSSVVSQVEIQVKSTPSGADVEFNGMYIGTTPCSVRVPAEPGTLTITLDGYKPWSKKVQPQEGMNVSPTLGKLPPAPVVVPATPEQGI